MADQVDRSVLPLRRPVFVGVVNRTLAGSRPDWSILSSPQAPEGAPNVLVVLTDDAGFGQPSTFGGEVSTPCLSRLAENGLRYNAFHVTALCSPTRAALLTGRNHHPVGFGSIGELSTGFPGYSGFFPKDSAPFTRVLQENGYSTAAFGKWHLTPDHQQGPAGPFDRWPNRLGFDYFWGFLGGEAGQYDPVITENQTTIGPPPADEDFYFPDAMTDKTIEWLHGVRAQEPGKPWFVYYSTGCVHAPHHVPPDWSARYKGRFDQGWDAYREQTFERQKRLGVIPADAELTPRNEAFPALHRRFGDRRHRTLPVTGETVRLHRPVPARVLQPGNTDRRGPLSKHGPRYLRWELFEAAMNACKHPVYAERYQRTKRRLGRERGPKVAQIELSRKLTEAIWHILTRNQPFAPAGAGIRLAA